MQAPERKPTTALLFDSSIEGIGDTLALVTLLALNSKNEARVTSLSVSRNDLKVAAYCDSLCRFFGVQLSIGMSESGTATDTVLPMISAVLTRQSADGKPAYARRVERLNETADPVALIRNALSAQPDQNSVVVLAGQPENLLGVLALPGGRELIQKKVRSLVIASGPTDTAAFERLLNGWPGTVVFATDVTLLSLRFPGANLEEDFSWSASHPLVDAYKAAGAMPYDAPATAMAGVLYAVHPDVPYFKVGSQGQHPKITVQPEQREPLLQALRQIVSTKPAESRRGPQGPQP